MPAIAVAAPPPGAPGGPPPTGAMQGPPGGTPMPTPPASQKKLTIVAVYAHPDDGEFMAGGALAKWAAMGHRVVAICATDGALGSKHDAGDPHQIAATRARELTAALAAIGAEPPILLNFSDGALREHALALRERLIYHFRRLRPDRVLTFDPFTHYEIHPDHIEAGRMASEAAVMSGFPLVHPEHAKEHLAASQPAEVWFMGPLAHRPNRIVEIKTTIDKKVAATLEHGSQLEMLADWFVHGADPRHLSDGQKAQIKVGARRFLEMAGRGVARPFAGKVELGEAFFAVRTGTGHFDNYPQLYAEELGAPPEEPLIE